MKRNLSLFVMTLGLSVSAFATTNYCNVTLSNLATNGCTFSDGSGQSYTINDVTFLGLGVLANASNEDHIGVTATIGANGPTVTLTPDSTFAAGLASTITYIFGFDITSNSANIKFNDVGLSTTSALTGVVSVGAVLEEDCYGGLLPNPVGVLSLGGGGLACLSGGLATGAQANLTNGTVTADIPLPLGNQPVSSVDVLKQINITTVVGTASVSSVSQAFGTVNSSLATPEPASFFLGGCGLVALALLRPRKWRANREK